MSVFLDHNFFLKIFENSNSFKLILEKNGERIPIPQCGNSVKCEKSKLEETISFVHKQLIKRGVLY